MASLNEIRARFLDFFARQGHEVVPSSPLVPRNDPTLMFVNSGMVQFKNLFTGLEQRDYARAVTSQKCVRAGGKHNDLDNVGYTARHHTFFEMLGNFSFGDYFKEAAIPHAWDFVTGELGLDPARLLVTVYETDDAAAEIWRRHAGLPEDRILRIAGDDNFWSMGPVGPCGPCSEIFYDHGPEVPGGPPGSPEEDGDRFVEIWNLVFMQYEQHEDGTRTDLPRPSIDTGMGLERIGAVLQGKRDNYDTDLFRALIEASAGATGTEPDGPGNVHHRVIADHLRATAFLIADGVLPSGDGRGYVLRRIMRRAMRHASLLGVEEPVIHRLLPALVAQMGAAYPELHRAETLIAETIRTEESRFLATLARGLRMLDDAVAGLPEGAELPGEVAFKLYDTHGFPLDLTQDALRERGRGVDIAGFEREMEAQRARARAAWAGSGETREAAIWFDLAEQHGPTEFLGHDSETAEGQVLAVVADGAARDGAEAGAAVQIVVNQTPFYAEAGGQVGDTGTLVTPGGRARITDTQKSAGIHIHFAEVESGRVAAGEAARLEVDHDRRGAIRANHSATHLMHQALRDRLGDHVAQRGSLNAPDRLRFDFSHGAALSGDDIAEIERDVTAIIRQDSEVATRIMTPDSARELGALALFGEKYGEEVRVVSMGRAETGRGGDGRTWSIELCGGTHVARTGEIGPFTITAQSASAAGVRRIEAVTGEAARAHLDAQRRRLSEVADLLKTRPEDAPERVRALIEERRTLEGQLAELRRAQALGGGAGPAGEAPRDVAGVPFLARRLDGVSGKELPALIDRLKDQVGSGAILLIGESGGKAAVAAGVTGDVTARLSAVDMVRAAVAELGGKGGGGRADMAQGGGPAPENADAAIAAVEALIAGEGERARA